ncbi:3-dehydro-L-gulonate 2-dehydrogenase [Mucilaginibacter koreensis]
MRIPFHQLKAEFERVLLGLQFAAGKASDVAAIFAENSLNGVYTHGLNRFPVFVDYVKQGVIHVDAEPTAEQSLGLIERWNGNLGPGMLNARFCMDRAIQLAKQHGIGCVAIKNTNHWMRGGTYGWQAADAGCIGICFTNTIANLPPWGGLDPRLGNNPLVIAVPRAEGHVVLDMAVSQYSFGKLLQYQSSGEELPLPGGYDEQGNLSTDASAIIASKRLLPAGFWKGSGLSLMLDLLATILSRGNSTAAITKGKIESGVSQVFICIRPDDDALTGQLIEQILDYTKSSEPVQLGRTITYPGENTLRTRQRNLAEGIPVDEQIWQRVRAL